MNPFSDYVPASDEERRYLSEYDPSGFPPVATTVDVVCFTIRSGRLAVLLVERGGFPYKGAWAIPGGFVEPSEDTDEAAVRELEEETGLGTAVGHLEQLGTFGAPGRDPRMRVFSVSYMAFLPDLPDPEAGSDASGARFWAVDDLGVLEGTTPSEDAPVLAFDHAEILRVAIDRARAKLEYTPLATAFVDETFTLPELRRVYEAVWGTELPAANFRRKVLSTPGFVTPVNETVSESVGRPAALYRRGDARLLHPPILSPHTKRAAGMTDEAEVR